jgi:UDP-N-acetylglucosamine--N-acetylmuramyl-(pentapeptide) pyrophosphoryl-undecaprenol N-acetylglucosamine transferase
VRSDIGLATDRRESFDYFNLNADVEVVLVLGGSLGARTINESIVQNIAVWMESGKQLIWQTGKLYYEEMQRRVPEEALSTIHLLEYIDRMDLAYTAADLVISRAGALSISELCLVNKPVIFIPSPNVAEDHQTKNANALVEQDAAVMVKDKEAVSELAQTALQLLENNDKMEQLASNISRMGKPGATQDIAEEILTLAGHEWK